MQRILFASEGWDATAREEGELRALARSAPFEKDFDASSEVKITAYPALEEPRAVGSVHRTWRRAYLPKVASPPDAPRLDPDAAAPAGARLVEIEFVRRRIGGRFNHFGFEGAFLSLVVAQDLHTLLDTRREKVE